MKRFFQKKSRTEKLDIYNSQEQIPVVKSSICNGEKVAGFKNKKTGKFNEVTFIKNEMDLNKFLSDYQIPAEDLKNEW